MGLKIETGQDNPILRRKSQTIKKVDEKVLELARRMKQTMAENNGAGLAAPQVGINIRIFVIPEELCEKTVFINPEIIKKSKKKEIVEEGCLSLPDLFVPIERSKEIKIKAIDENNKQFKLKAKGLLARALQHESEHLDGILITDK